MLTAHAATPLATIERALATHGQRLAFEPPDFGALLGTARPQTIGGVLAANLAGSRRVTAGAARDHFLGFRAVDGRGEPFKAGGKVVKNVTGYDLPKLLAGSWGTLAVLTEVTLRVAPAPELDRTLVVAAGSAGECLALLGAALRSPHDVSAAAVDPARGSVAAARGLRGFRRSAHARALRRAALHPGSGARRRCVARLLARARERAPRSPRAPSSGASRCRRRTRCACSSGSSPTAISLDWGGGLILAAFDDRRCARVRGALTTGHATLLKAPPAARAATPVFQPQAPAVAAAAAARRATRSIRAAS